MFTVSSSTISSLERDAMAGLLKLQGLKVQEKAKPKPEVKPIKKNDDYVQTATAAWVLTRCFSPNRTSSPYESLAQSWATEASGDGSSNSSPISSPKAFPQPCNNTHKIKQCCVDSNSHPSGCCCCYTHSSMECSGCGRKVLTRDVGSQTDSSHDTTTGALTDVSSEEGATSRLEQLIREAMKRKNDVLPAEPTTPVVATRMKQVTLVPTKTQTPKTTKVPIKKPIIVHHELLPEPFEDDGLMDSDEEWQPTEFTRKSKLNRRRYTSSGSNKENLDTSAYSDLDETMEEQPNTESQQDLVPIGDGNAKIPARLLKHMNWTSYTSVTRKLLTAVFSRSVLATHSLTGKPSPAFPNKPAKKKLDASLVNDIVQTVVERCGVPENVVRTSITTKCADESKMFRTRQRNKKFKSP